MYSERVCQFYTSQIELAYKKTTWTYFLNSRTSLEYKLYKANFMEIILNL